MKTEENSGPGVARNLGLQKSNASFVTFMDDDDTIVQDVLPFCLPDYDFSVSACFTNNNALFVPTESYVCPLYGIVFPKLFMIIVETIKVCPLISLL